jgi:hypothetical protein
MQQMHAVHSSCMPCLPLATKAALTHCCCEVVRSAALDTVCAAPFVCCLQKQLSTTGTFSETIRHAHARRHSTSVLIRAISDLG